MITVSRSLGLLALDSAGWQYLTFRLGAISRCHFGREEYGLSSTAKFITFQNYALNLNRKVIILRPGQIRKSFLRRTPNSASRASSDFGECFRSVYGMPISRPFFLQEIGLARSHSTICIRWVILH